MNKARQVPKPSALTERGLLPPEAADCATALAAERRRPERCRNRDQELKREPIPCLINSAGSYTYPTRKSVRMTRATPDDKVHMHTIFRMPGFIPRPFGKKKVAVLAQHYGQWHGGIEPIAERVNEHNIDRLSHFDFVFVSVDSGPSRRLIVDWLSSRGIPFVDCGMGLNRVLGGLNGTVRITGVDRQAYERTINTAYLPTTEAKEDEYRKQGQIAELNALNAAFAVVRFKQHLGVFAREDESAWYTWETASFSIDTERTVR
jgi:hypothetical protein